MPRPSHPPFFDHPNNTGFVIVIITEKIPFGDTAGERQLKVPAYEVFS
jgi:hypothetical protein